MGIKKQLMEQFNQIEDVFLEIEDNNEFLRVATKLRNLKDIEILSQKISKFLDDVNYGKNKYYLDVFSTDIEVSDEKLEQLIKK